ncbi:MULTISPECIES: AlpA family transcriptional regulator [Microbacterium]|nr:MULTISPECIES: excisionase family DNA-binding protein [Microbacterium]
MSHTEWRSIAEVAGDMGVSTDTVRRRITDGTIRAVKFGPRLIRIDMASVEGWTRPLTRDVA